MTTSVGLIVSECVLNYDHCVLLPSKRASIIFGRRIAISWVFLQAYSTRNPCTSSSNKSKN